MSHRSITYCPLCGGDLDIDDSGLSPSFECVDCGEDMRMEVWGYTPSFWHLG